MRIDRAHAPDRLRRRGRSPRCSRSAVATVAFDLPDRIADQQRAFERGNTPPGGADLRSRLTEGRQQRPAGDLGRRARRGRPRTRGGAPAPGRSGSCGSATARRRRRRWPTATRSTTRCGPSSAGSASRCCSSSSRSRSAWRSRGCGGPGATPTRPSWRPAIALLVHAMVDWDWEMPALFLWFFGAAGASSPRRPRPRRAASRGGSRACSPASRCLLVAVTPLTVARSPVAARTRRVHALRARRLRARRPTRRSAASTRSARRPRRSRSSAGATRAPASRSSRWRRCATRQRRDPDNWHYAYGLAVAQALAGEDPRPAAALARRLNPLEPLTIALERRLRTRQRRRAGGAVAATRADPARELTTRGGPEPASREMRRCGACSALVAGAAPQHQARAQQRDAAEQDRDGREAGERELVVVGARLDLPRRLESLAAAFGAVPPPLLLGRACRTPVS